jgi:hypothetical protein
MPWFAVTRMDGESKVVRNAADSRGLPFPRKHDRNFVHVGKRGGHGTDHFGKAGDPCPASIQVVLGLLIT